ncbi:hypothetical protein C3E97_011230 [Pseudomonas sp. MWU12-2115]|nr:hypothetical protein C3E97_011230 [Pseudomonas sp. MWU12-2115]
MQLVDLQHVRNPSITPKTLWERACSRMRRHIQHFQRLMHRFREQARSHRLCIRKIQRPR